MASELPHPGLIPVCRRQPEQIKAGERNGGEFAERVAVLGEHLCSVARSFLEKYLPPTVDESTHLSKAATSRRSPRPSHTAPLFRATV